MYQILLQFVRFIFALLVVINLSSCDSTSSKNEDIWVVGTSPDNPPYEFVHDGKIVGFDIDLINAIAEACNKKISIEQYEFMNLFGALTTNKIDMIIAGLSVTEARSDNVLFSQPYISANVALIYDSELNKIDSLEDLKGKTIGAQIGSTFNDVAKEISEKYGAELTSLANNLILIEELKNNNIHGVILEQAQVKNFMEHYESFSMFKIEEACLSSSSFAIALSKQNKDNIELINNAIEKLKNDGTIDSIARKWGL